MTVVVTERKTGNVYQIARGKSIGRETKQSQGVTFVGDWWVYATPSDAVDPGDPIAVISSEGALIVEVIDDPETDAVTEAVATLPSPLPPFGGTGVTSISTVTPGGVGTIIHNNALDLDPLDPGIDPAYERIAELVASGHELQMSEVGPAYTQRGSEAGCYG